MALVPTYSSLYTKDQVPPLSKSMKLKGRSIADDCSARQKKSKYFCSFYGNRRNDVLHHTTFQNKGKTRQGADVFSTVCQRTSMAFQVTGLHVLCTLRDEENEMSSSLKNKLHTDKHPMTMYASESSSIGRQLEALDSYFGKLRNNSHKQQPSFISSGDSETMPISENELQPSSNIPSKTTDIEAQKGLASLEIYHSKLKAIKSHKTILTTKEMNLMRSEQHVNRDYGSSEEKMVENYVQFEKMDDEPNPKFSQGVQPQEETSDLYLICVLASMNIGVFLFEKASPVKTSDVELLTLPSLYGAKINQLILDGEWWRLVTPMFLHSGIFHVALGFWVLLSFAPQVCKGYGSFTFFLIYLLGGISGNMTSYIHTPEPTVGGTGPIFAIIGAWLIYQFQNKEAIEKEVSESMFRKAVIATALSFVLSNFGPIDNWSHLGAACVGIAYGFLTCPTLQLDNLPSKTDKKNGFALVRHYADPCKSIVTFAVFIVILSSLLLFVEPQVDTLENSFM
ncbi:hypothetical protein IFM89_011596 [Coptis chinensis]|uniref:Peptidase S54 rhomboid domain-containing protein n=1 Tax=Coptis chinensis TaxID=261450 RepID=A0A835LDZ1_9MAGN|nr:hypothetical protein IFM89_011596 [Coptis chinensis]